MVRFPLLLSLAGVLSAASYTVETSATCNITTSQEVVSRRLTNVTEGCHASAADGSIATAEADVYLFSEPLQEGGLNLSVNVAGGIIVHLADADPDIEVTRFDHEGVSAAMSANVTLFLATGGPRRPGILDSGLFQDYGAGLEYSLPENFELGTPFEMSLAVYMGSFINAAEPEELWRGGFGGQSFRFPRVYEADGVTPVALMWSDPPPNVDNPEPGTMVLLGLGLAVVAAAKRLKKPFAYLDASKCNPISSSSSRSSS